MTIPDRSAPAPWRSGLNEITRELAAEMAFGGAGTVDDEPCDVFTVGDRVIRLSAKTREQRSLGTVIAEDGPDVLVWFEDQKARPVARDCLRRLGVRADTDRRLAHVRYPGSSSECVIATVSHQHVPHPDHPGVWACVGCGDQIECSCDMTEVGQANCEVHGIEL